MSLVDSILNLAALLLWLNWRSVRLDPMSKAVPATLPGTLRRAVPKRLGRWHFLAALFALMLVRAWFYWQIGAAVNWAARLNLGVISISFRSDFLDRMLLFSVVSFGVTLAVFYLWLLYFSAVNARTTGDPFQKLVRLMLGRLDRWPCWIKLLLPLIIATICWLGLSLLLAHMGLVPTGIPLVAQLGQGALIGLSAYLTWQFLIATVLVLHLVNSYIYLGNHPLWNFINLTARQTLRPLRKL
ncbi:MAG TPA: hypothetical protein VKA67_03750, partial [Verrucomicrobiae bacterium]|nr:hypothetical protein [Verrucomicrobiae bacterium]